MMRGVGAVALGLGIAAGGAGLSWAAGAQAAPEAKSAINTHPKRALHKRAAAVAPAPEPQAAPVPPEPEKPKWPANQPANPPYVRWDSQGLKISAFNSDLSTILNDVANETGAKIEGLGDDERVFGDYGPGQARDVLAQLLHGSPYDYMVLGDQGQGTPREIILTKHRESGAAQQGNASRPTQENQDDDYQPPEPDDQPQPPVFRPQMNPPGMPPRTPQQRFEEMRQRQLQMQQQQQQQQPPEQPAPPPQ